MAKGKENGSAPVQVQFKDAAELNGSLAALAREVRLPIAVAWRVALMRKEVEAGADAWAEEQRKIRKPFLDRVKKAPEREVPEVLAELNEQLQAEGSKTFPVAGSISYEVIKDGVGDTKPENLGNILAGLMPVLTELPAE